MKICLIAAFPPSGGPLNEYSFHIAREIQRHPGIELTILGDELEDSATSTDSHGNPLRVEQLPEPEGFHVIRCWKFGSMKTPARLLRAIHDAKPDVVWFNLVFSSFGTFKDPLAAFAGLAVPALTRSAGYYTHVTLHHIVEHVDFAASGVRQEKLYRLGTNMVTRTLLRANSVSVLLSAYRKTLMEKYSAQNVILGTHGIFTPLPSPPDFSKRNNPEVRILAFGHWGTYKRLETLMEAFPAVLAAIPNARLIVGGGNHPTKLGYWESIRDAQPSHLPITFLGYVPTKEVPELFATSSVLVMPYDSSTGSSGPAHQACEYGVPILCADILDFRCMAADEDMAIRFFKIGDAPDLAEQLITVLQSKDLQREMGMHNYQAGVQMTMASIVRTYLRWFELHQQKRALAAKISLAGKRRHWLRRRLGQNKQPLIEGGRSSNRLISPANQDRHHSEGDQNLNQRSDRQRPSGLENA